MPNDEVFRATKSREFLGDSSISQDVTEILSRIRTGAPDATKDLFEVVYAELQAMARGYMARERPGHTLQATVLVNEAYLKLVRPDGQSRIWENRRHFFGAASRAMRQILVNHAKRARPGRVALKSDVAINAERSLDMVALDEALKRLEARDPRKCRVVELRYFAGLSVPETAKVLEVSPRTVDNDWRFAKAWLKSQIDHGDPDGQ